jgi:hypothetical protein
MSSKIIYLHGFASSPESRKARLFRERLERLGVDVSVPDLAAGDFENLTITSQMRIIEHAAQGEAVALVGSSMGGYLAALYASLHLEVTKLVLMAPAFGFVRRWPERQDPDVMAAWRRTGMTSVFHYGEGRNRDLSYELLEDGLKYPDFPDFRQPALIYHGQHDDVVPVEWSREFLATHPNAQLRVVDSDHELSSAIEEIWQGAEDFLVEKP